MKDLPKVFANSINKEFKNNREVYNSSLNENRVISHENIPQKINEIFASPHHVYKSRVYIKTKTGEIDAIIVGKTNNVLLTLKGDRINIDEILDIEKI